MDIEEKRELALNKYRKQVLLKEMQKRNAKKNLLDFCKYTKKDYIDQWFHRHICEKIDSFMQSDNEMLILTAPPQHGKSEISSRRFPAYELGKNPSLKIGLVSYSKDIASGFNDDVKDIIASSKYRTIFPGTKIAGVGGLKENELKKNSYIFSTSDNGYFISVGVGGSLTSKTIDLLIIDDLYKNPEQGWSASHRKKVSEWFWSVAYTRLHNNSKIILLFTRWAEDDLAGELLEFFKGKKIDYINLEAIKETTKIEEDPREIGEALWEMRHKKEKLLTIKEKNNIIFESLYQGNPKPLKGLMYSKGFKTYGQEKLQELQNLGCPVKSYTDTADTGSDYLSTYFFYEHNKQVYIKDVIFTKKDMSETIGIWAEKHAEHQVNFAKIEYNNGGHPFKLYAEDKLKNIYNYYGCYIEGFHQTQNKNTRILSQAAWIQENVFFPENWSLVWEELYIDLNRYSKEGKNKHDDAEDALTGVAEMVNESGFRGIIEIDYNEEEFFDEW